MATLKTSERALDPAQLRRTVLEMSFAGQSVHVGCAFSLIEIITTLFSKILRFNPHDPSDPARDYFILSKGHGVMAVYAAYRALGWLPQSDLDQYFKDGSRLHGLCEFKTPGLEVASGSLGHGLPIATGMAFGLKRRGDIQQKVFCVVGDGEMNEGTMWESLLFAAHHKLENLVVIVDANGFQAMGEIESVLSLEPLAAKFTSFGFETHECDGHDAQKLAQVFAAMASSGSPKPKALIARTVKGKGVSFMEANNDWHYLRLTPEILARALSELKVGEAPHAQ